MDHLGSVKQSKCHNKENTSSFYIALVAHLCVCLFLFPTYHHSAIVKKDLKWAGLLRDCCHDLMCTPAGEMS